MPRMIVIALLAWAAGAQMETQARAEDWVVDNIRGDDQADGQSRPFRTINRALRAAKRSDRILLTPNKDEPYREAISVQGGRNSGAPKKPFTIIGNGAVLDGSRAVPEEDWEYVSKGVFRVAPRFKSFQMMYIDGRPASRVIAPPEAVGLPELKEKQWCLFERYLYFRPKKTKLPRDYKIAYADKKAGITLYQVRNVLISDVTVQGYQLDGLNAHDSAFEVTLSGVTARGNARSGMSIGGASRVRLEGCLLGNNGTMQLRTEGASHTYLAETDLLSNTAPAIVNDGGGKVYGQNAADAQK